MAAKLSFEKWRLWIVILLVAITSTLAYGTILLNQNVQEVKEISQQNNRFVDNFSNYMNCLIVGEDEVVLAVGEETYVEICKQLLYRGLDDIPPTIKATIPPHLITTTTTGGD